jgi:hypothetical protein
MRYSIYELNHWLIVTMSNLVIGSHCYIVIKEQYSYYM